MVNSSDFHLGAALNALIARSGKQKNQLAVHLGVSEQAVQKWLKTGMIARENIGPICKYLDCSADELLGLRPIGDLPMSQSQPVRLSGDIVHGVARAIQDTSEELNVALSSKEAIELFAEVYERVGESGITTADVVWLVRRLERGMEQDARADGVRNGM